MAPKPRNYKREDAMYEDNPVQVKERENRNTARRQAEKKGQVHKGDGLEVDHKDGNPLHNSPKNRQILTRHANRKKA
jgi:hypothetical protein